MEIWHLWKKGEERRIRQEVSHLWHSSREVLARPMECLWVSKSLVKEVLCLIGMGRSVSLPCSLPGWGAAYGQCGLKPMKGWTPRGSSWSPQGFCLMQQEIWAVHFHGKMLKQLWLYLDVKKWEQEDKGSLSWQPHFSLKYGALRFNLAKMKKEERTELGKGLVWWRFGTAETEKINDFVPHKVSLRMET